MSPRMAFGDGQINSIESDGVAKGFAEAACLMQAMT